MKKTMKKIASIGVAAAVAATSMTGAMAADLSDLPAPFVKDGVENFEIVVGAAAQPSDVIGAIDIAAAFQAKAVTETSVEVAGSGVTTTVSDGVQVEGNQTEDYLVLNEEPSDEQFDAQDLPELLADGTISDIDGEDQSGNDLDNEDIDYDQDLFVGDISVVFDDGHQSQDDEAGIYLSSETAAYTYRLNVTFDDPVNFVGMEDAETIELAGQTFTIGSDTTASNLVLFGSDATTLLQINNPVAIEVEGQSYEVTLVGIENNDGTDAVTINVDGVQKDIDEGDTEEINGLDIYVKDVSIFNVGADSGSATVFVGSDEIEVAWGGKIEIDGEDLDSYEFEGVVGTGFDNVTAMSFTYKMIDEEETEDEILLLGESRVDPFFNTFELVFAGSSLALDSEAKVPFMLNAGGSVGSVSYENVDGEMIEFDMVEESGTNLVYVDDFIFAPTAVSTATNLTEGNYFMINDGVERSSIMEIVDIDPTENEITVLDWGTGSEKTYSSGESIDDSEFVVGDINDRATDNVVLTGTDATQIQLRGDSTIDVTALAADVVEFEFTELGDAGDATGFASLEFNMTLDGDDDVFVTSITETTSGLFTTASNNDDDQLGLSEFGTYFVADEDGFDFALYVPEDDEVEYNVFIAPTGASVISGGSAGSSITTESVNPFGVGVGKLDSEVSLATSTKNMIVVGGPCANTIAAELMGSPADCTEGFVPGEAMIKLMDNEDQDTVAMLVAGYDSIATRAAANAVVQMEDLSGEEVVLTSITSASNYQILQ